MDTVTPPLRQLTLTIKALPFIKMEPFHPMYGQPQPQRFLFQVLDEEGNVMVRGVTSDPQHAAKCLLEKAAQPVKQPEPV